ncbi:MAG TPA: hypothetical protein VIN72_05690 [Lutibacter sp.]
MIIFNKLTSNNILKIIGLFLVFVMLQSCKAYKSPTNLEQAANVQEKGYVKVTMVNGDEYIYEAIEFSEDTYYGVKMVDAEIVKTILLKEEVLKVEKRNKSGFGVLGIVIGLGSVILAILMFS